MSLADIQDVKHELEKRIAGEVRLDAASRKLYSTDASIYEIEPLGVVIPRHEDDLIATMEVAAKYGVPVLPRGSGSSLAGQTVGAALVVDCSRYLNQLRKINAEEKYAIVQPGMVLDRFNSAAASHGLKYGPDPASADRASFGGMLGNNSTGAHSILFGMSSDNVLEMNVVLADGTATSFAEIDREQAHRRAEGDGLEAAIYAASLDIQQRHANEIRELWPRSWRRASGYSLNYLLDWAPSRPPLWEQGVGGPYPPRGERVMNLAPMLVGSEGTLALTRSAKIRLVPIPNRTVLGVLAFNSEAEACDAAPELLELKPSSIELIPQAMIRLARSVPAYANRLWFVPGEPAAILLVEFSSASEAELDAKLAALGSKAVLARSQEEQAEIWSVRKVGLGLLMSRIGDSKPLPFIEDVAVPVERLGAFVRNLKRIFAEHGTEGDFYAHASAGCLHVRPLVNLKTLEGIRQMRGITEEVVKLANQFGGAMSGEHGDGLARSEWLEATFGPVLMAAFRQLKNAADPQGILNPGKVLDAPPMDKNLRYGPGYSTKTWSTVFSFEGQGGLAGAIEMCNGAGVCRKHGGVMCPSFQASQEEMHSTRGRANLLRSMISGGLPKTDAQQAAYEALDLCLECKGCKAECPSAVDVAKLKYEFLNHFYEDHRRPLRDYLFAHLGGYGHLARGLAPLSNVLLSSAPGKWLGERLFGLSARRGLPAFKRNGRPQLESENYDVLLLNDPFTEFFYPHILTSAIGILQAAGYQPRVLPLLGAGRPLISKGFLPSAKAHAENLIEMIDEFDPFSKMSIVGLEPSELYALKDEYLDFFPGDKSVRELAQRAFMLEEFLIRPDEWGKVRTDGLALRAESGKVLLHGHCYQKAQPPAEDGFAVGQAASAAMLRNLGWEVEIVDSGCCGMAGSFGYEAEHYELSMQVGELALFPAVRAADAERVVVAPGVSCRSQIASGTQREALHPVDLIAEILE